MFRNFQAFSRSPAAGLGPPCAEIIERSADGSRLRLDIALIPVARAFTTKVVAGLVVPLLQPRDEFEKTGENGYQFPATKGIRSPTILRLSFMKEGRQRRCSLQEVPSRPSKERNAVILLQVGVRDEAFFREVKLSS